MGTLLGKLGGLLAEEYKLQKGVKGEITSLRAELESMHAFLQDLDNLEEPSAQVKAWMKEVRELAYDIEDCVDDFMHHLGREPNEPSGIKRFFTKKIRKLKKLGTRHEIAERIQELKARVVETSQRRERYKVDAAVSGSSNVVPSYHVPVDPRLPALYAEAESLVGILIRWLTQGKKSYSAQQLKVVSIVGFAGVGKTTLANQVYHKIKG